MWRCLIPLALASGLACAKGPPPEAPITNAEQMCCQKGDAETGLFGGCEVSPKIRQCPESHPLWIRGTISCGPVDAENCLGGRCCEFGEAWGSEGAALDWDPPDAAKEKESAASEGTDSEGADGDSTQDATTEAELSGDTSAGGDVAKSGADAGESKAE